MVGGGEKCSLNIFSRLVACINRRRAIKNCVKWRGPKYIYINVCLNICYVKRNRDGRKPDALNG